MGLRGMSYALPWATILTSRSPSPGTEERLPPLFAHTTDHVPNWSECYRPCPELSKERTPFGRLVPTGRVRLWPAGRAMFGAGAARRKPVRLTAGNAQIIERVRVRRACYRGKRRWGHPSKLNPSPYKVPCSSPGFQRKSGWFTGRNLNAYGFFTFQPAFINSAVYGSGTTPSEA
jgi:hypothetical protein